MKADPKFATLPKSFWAAVRSISQEVGYTIRGESQVKIPTTDEIRQAFDNLRLNPDRVGDAKNPTELANTLLAYYEHRANVLNKFVEPRLMDVKEPLNKFPKHHFSREGAKVAKFFLLVLQMGFFAFLAASRAKNI